MLSDGGNLDGYIAAADPGDEVAARFSAPAPFLGNQLNLIGTVLSFDATVNISGPVCCGPRVPGLIAMENSAKNRMLAFVGTPVPAAGVWTHYDVTLAANALAAGAAGSWLAYPIGPLQPIKATAQDFLDVFENITRLTITGEYIDGLEDIAGIDNVHAVPVPAAMPLLFSALLGLAAARRKTHLLRSS